MAPHIRTVKTASGARAVQIVHSHRSGKRTMEHIGSAHTDAEHAALIAVARQKLEAGQLALDLRVPGGSLGHITDIPVTGTRLGVLWEVLEHAYTTLGFEQALPHAGRGVDVFKALVLARIIEPTSKLDTLRVLAEHGLPAPSYKTVQRHLPSIATPELRGALAVACAAHTDLSPTSLVLYDVTTLYFETDEGDGFREPGFSKERRLEPQITVGLLTDATGFPLQVTAFEGNRAETTTMLPVLNEFMTHHGLKDIIVVADAGMVSDANKRAL